MNPPDPATCLPRDTPTGGRPTGRTAPPATGTDAWVDVLIPVYNGAPWLRASIDSIRSQGHRRLRIHVVDDGSTDATPAILADLRSADDRIRTYRQPNGGIVDALNHGLAACGAEWLARHDADDLAHPDRIERQLDYLRAHPDCVAVGSMARHIDATGQPLGSFVSLRPPELADATWFPAREPYLMHPFLMARRAAVAAVGGYRHSPHSEDSDLYWRLSRIGRLHNLPDVLGDYRMHTASITGGSILNGRTMAVGSQLAAVSARRQAGGGEPLAFERGLMGDLRRAARLAAMVQCAALRLHDDERHRFDLAVAAKLLELTTYLPFELDPDDAAFVARAYREGRHRIVRPGNRRSVDRQLALAAIRLWVAGRRREALALLPSDQWPEFLGRQALRVGWVAEALRRWRGRPVVADPR